MLKPAVSSAPYYARFEVHPTADKFIILACDGLWDVISDQEAVCYLHFTGFKQEVELAAHKGCSYIIISVQGENHPTLAVTKTYARMSQFMLNWPLQTHTHTHIALFLKHTQKCLRMLSGYENDHHILLFPEVCMEIP